MKAFIIVFAIISNGWLEYKPGRCLTRKIRTQFPPEKNEEVRICVA